MSMVKKVERDMKESCRRIDFTTGYANSDGKMLPGMESEVTVLYNLHVISETEVEQLITTGRYEYDNRVIVTTPEAADAFCRGIIPQGKG